MLSPCLNHVVVGCACLAHMQIICKTGNSEFLDKVLPDQCCIFQGSRIFFPDLHGRLN